MHTLDCPEFLRGPKNKVVIFFRCLSVQLFLLMLSIAVLE